MKFWKTLRWVASALLLAIFIWALIAGYPGGSVTDDVSDMPAAPKFH